MTFKFTNITFVDLDAFVGSDFILSFLFANCFQASD
jgi:hypothetical protein